MYSKLGWPVNSSEKMLVHWILLSPTKENINYPKGLPTVDDINPALPIIRKNTIMPIV